jgi:hypothetical protein
MTEVTESIPEDDAQKLQHRKEDKQPSSGPSKTDKSHAPSSGQTEQRDSTIGKSASAPGMDNG